MILVTCNTCGKYQVVNGQKQIENYGLLHRHDFTDIELKTGKHISISYNIPSNKPELITGSIRETIKTRH